MRKTLQIVLLFIVVLTACNSKNNYIIPTDFSLLIPDSTQISNGITVKQQEKRSAEFFNTLRANTINHEIPEATIFDLKGQSQNLKEKLTDKKIIISTSLTCAWNMTGLLNDFPKANQYVENPIHQNEIILLILKENNDYFHQQFERNIEEIKRNYSNIYLVDSIQSLKLNMFGLSRYYISKHHIVLNIGMGTATKEGDLENEIRKNTVANSK